MDASRRGAGIHRRSRLAGRELFAAGRLVCMRRSLTISCRKNQRPAFTSGSSGVHLGPSLRCQFVIARPRRRRVRS